MQGLKEQIIGPTDPAVLVATIFFAGLGILVVLLMGTTLRDKNSIYSPAKFSWDYLLCDNNKRIIGSFLCVLLSIRFMPEVFGLDIKPWHGLLLGMSWDSLFLFIKQKTSILDPKPKP